MKRKIFSVLIAVGMIISMLAACTNDEPTDNGNDVENGTEAVDDSGDINADADDDAGDDDGAAAGADTNNDVQLSGQLTVAGTPRELTLIVEMQSPTDTPGQFNTFMPGTSAGSGIHQLMSAMMWEMDTVRGEQFGDVAADLPTSNDDFTEHIIPIREGIRWSDGTPLTAYDVAFTFNMIKDNPGIPQSAYYNMVFEVVEAIDEFTVRAVTTEPFPRLAQRFGVTIWGNDLRIVPKHIYSELDDVTTFPDSNPVVAGPYTVHSFDPLGTWILYERRADWQYSTVGVVTGRKPQAPYVLFKALGDDTTRQMAMISNEVDIMVEVTPEMLNVMVAQNPNIGAWYSEFPFATSDDPCSKGLTFNHMIAPFDHPSFRWGVALAMDFDEISMNIFDGVGRASPFPILTATAAMMELYYLPMLDWVMEFELELGNGDTIRPFDPGYGERMAERLRALGHDIPDDPDKILDMFGIGHWVYDPEAATQLFIDAGLELRDGNWYFDGEPFVFTMTYLADTEIQAGRGVQAAFNQLTRFGFNVNIASESSATWDSNAQTGNFEIAGQWPNGGIMKDLYTMIQGFHNDLIVPIGEIGAGQAIRWNNQEASDLITELSALSPQDPRSYEIGIEWMKIAIQDMPVLTFHSGVKFVPVNTTFWTNYPTADNPYNGPWWWWSCFKYILTEITPQ